MAIVVNKPLPEFEANATGGIKVSNTSHLGQVMVLYFYPKDNTPGCTTEALQFRDRYKDFVKAGAAVFGVSRDNMKSHEDFKEKLELPFELVADTEEKMCHMFGVVKNKLDEAVAEGVAVDRDGNIYVGETVPGTTLTGQPGGHIVRKFERLK